MRQTASAPAQLVRLHVAVLVDDKAGTDGKPVARDARKMGELLALARQAAGIDDARGDQIELHAIAFAPDPEATPVAADATPAAAELPLVPLAIGGGALLFVIVVAVLSCAAAAPSARRREAAEATRATDSLARPVPVAELARALEARPQLEPATSRDRAARRAARCQDRVLEAVAGDVERAASVLSAWLAEPPPQAAKPEAARGAK